jgi:uncharacterized Rmd1/YagE family protein
MPDWRTVMQLPRIVENDAGVRIAILRWGAVVIGEPASGDVTPVPESVREKIVGPFSGNETESALIVLGDPDKSEASSEGLFTLLDFSVERFSILADALAKSAALAQDEQRIGAVFEQLEPFARQLADTGHTMRSRESLRLLGGALLAQHRMVGRVEFDEKPDILWDRPDLLRLYNRLDEEYELGERGRGLSRKLKVIEETAQAIADVSDAHISRRLEIAIVAMIAFEIALTLGTMAFGGGH